VQQFLAALVKLVRTAEWCLRCQHYQYLRTYFFHVFPMLNSCTWISLKGANLSSYPARLLTSLIVYFFGSPGGEILGRIHQLPQSELDSRGSGRSPPSCAGNVRRRENLFHRSADKLPVTCWTLIMCFRDPQTAVGLHLPTGLAVGPRSLAVSSSFRMVPCTASDKLPSRLLVRGICTYRNP